VSSKNPSLKKDKKNRKQLGNNPAQEWLVSYARRTAVTGCKKRCLKDFPGGASSTLAPATLHAQQAQNADRSPILLKPPEYCNPPGKRASSFGLEAEYSVFPPEGGTTNGVLEIIFRRNLLSGNDLGKSENFSLAKSLAEIYTYVHYAKRSNQQQRGAARPASKGVGRDPRQNLEARLLWNDPDRSSYSGRLDPVFSEEDRAD
jgi:hypothetical protein